MTPFVFFHGLEVLARSEIWFCDLDVEHQLWTDARGVVALDVAPGIHWFKLLVDGQWCYTTASLKPGQAEVRVHVHAPDAPLPALPHLRGEMERMLDALGGRYRFEAALGRGGAGVVIRARDRLLERDVALKVLHGDMRDDARAFRAFLREAQGLARLSHPNLIAIYDITQLADEVVLITEYVEGHNLGELVREQGALPEHVVLKLGIQLVRVLAYLHERAVLHRDIKPSNVMIQPDGTLKLIDFGLARALPGTSANARHTRSRGTPAYMAPEQVLGEHINGQTDLYQVGVTLYELLSGRLPFEGDDPRHGHVHLEPPPLRKVAPHVSGRLSDLVHRLLHKTPHARAASAHEVMAQLQQLYLTLGHDYPRKESISSMRHRRPPGVSTSSVLVDWHELAAEPPTMRRAPRALPRTTRRALQALAITTALALAFAAGTRWSPPRSPNPTHTTSPTHTLTPTPAPTPRTPPRDPHHPDHLPDPGQHLASLDPPTPPPLHPITISPPTPQPAPATGALNPHSALNALHLFASPTDDPPLLDPHEASPSGPAGHLPH